ncbi:hypothetical protein ACEPAG_3108 [Sanghuangporus baumii]
MSEPVTTTKHPYYGQEASLRLHILVIGCGLGGLAAAHCLTQAGHEVTIIEAAKRISEVGAGIQVSPNVTRLLERWGLKDRLAEVGVEPESIVFRRYDNGNIVGRSHWGEVMRRRHGAPYYHVHRADLHDLIYDTAIASPRVKLRLSSTVSTVDPTPKPQVSVTLTSGEVISGDIIVGADGVKSIVRTVVLGRPDKAEPTGDAAYRAIIPTSLMLEDPELKPFVDSPEMTAWMAPRRHLMAYCIRGKKEFNLVMIHPDGGSVESWTAEGSAEKLREDFADYDPRIHKLLSFVQSTLDWRLMDRKPLETWVHPDGRVVLLGDSCHPMLASASNTVMPKERGLTRIFSQPYRAQGAAMAIEDAAVLGSLLSHLSHISQIPILLKAYEKLRLERTAKTQASSRRNQRIFHLPDGPEQQARDKLMREAMELENECMKNGDLAQQENVTKGNPNQWADQSLNIEQFSFDADEVAEIWWKEEGEASLRESRENEALVA